MVAGPRQVLLERQAELAELASVIESAGRGSEAVLLVEGPPGIGKTRLLDEARTLARRSGLGALSGRCDFSERSFQFGLVRQLFEPVLGNRGDREGVLAGAAALAQPLFAGAAPSGALCTDDGELHDRLQGLYWLTSNLAERSPILLAVDDVHWSDAASLRFLSFLIRRIDELPVVVALTAVPEAIGGAPSQTLLQIRAGASRVLRPAPLSAEAVAALVRARLAEEPDDEFCEACREVTGGNPSLVRALVDELAFVGIAPTSAHVADVRELRPQAISQSVLLRMALLPAAALDLAQAVAVMGNRVELRHAGAVAGLPIGPAAAAADALVEANIFESGRPLRFVHAIVRTALVGALPHAARTAAHQRAATVLAEDGADPGQVASHLLLTEPRSDAEVVATLRKAAAAALAGDAPEFAVACLQRALIEPPAADIRGQVLVELGLAEARVPGREGLESLRRGIALTEDVHQRAQIVLHLARAIGSIADTGAVLELLDSTLTELRAADPTLALRLDAEFVSVARLYPVTRGRALERLRELRGADLPDGVTASLLLANDALLAVEEVRPADEAIDLAERALQRRLLLQERTWVLAYAANSLMWADRTDQAETVWTEALGKARSSGSMSTFVLACAWSSHLAYRAGALSRAEEHARLCLNVCRQRDWDAPLPYALAFLADALIERGELNAASALIDSCPSDDALHYLLHTRGRLRCLQDDVSGGLADLLECGHQLESRGGRDNPAIIPWRSSAASAMAHLGDMDEARRLAEEELDLACRFSAGRAVGIALRARALTETGDRRVELLSGAVGVLQDSPARLENARALIDLGVALAHAGRYSESKERLRAALDLAHNCGALVLRQRAHEELVAAGLRPQRYAIAGVESLTRMERRVAEMAAEGLTNREIGQALFVSIKTVEAHLHSVFRKLEIRARASLRPALEAEKTSESIPQAGEARTQRSVATEAEFGGDLRVAPR